MFLFTSLKEDNILQAYDNHCFGISTGLDNIDDNFSLAHYKGLYVMVWSPNNFSQNKYALSKKADIIPTDDPISILKYLERYSYEYIIP